MIKQGGKFVLILLFVYAGFFCFGNIKADELIVVINEIGAYETSDYEWIEIYNNSYSPVNLEGWKFVEGFTGSKPEGINHSIKEYNNGGYNLASYNYAVIANKPDKFQEKYPDFSGLLLDSSWSSLKEAGEHIQLKDMGGEIVENFIYIACPDYSLERINPKLNDYSLTNWQEHSTGNTVGRQNSNYSVDEIELNPEEQEEDIPQEEEKTPPEQQEEEEQEQEEDEDVDEAPSKIIITNKLGDIVINEFVSDPADEDVEWIELYNTINKEVILDGWTIEEGSGAKTTLEGILAGSGEGKFMIIEKPKGNLNNKGDIIILRDNQGILIDQVTYGNWDDGNINNNAPVTGDPFSVARKFDGQNSFNNANDFAVTVTLTKGTSNIITKTEEEQELADEVSAEEKALYDYSNDIIISEVFPNPSGSDSENEFIELYNKSERDVNLLGWRLGDESKKKYEFKNAKDANERQETLIIKVGEYFVIYRSESKIALNNGSDGVKLYQPLKDEPCQIVKYEKSIEGWSYVNTQIATNLEQIDTNKKWVWSEIVTPGEINEIKTINHPPIVDFDCPEEILVGAPTLFDSSDTVDEDGDELKFSWDFGDGFTNELASPEHTFFKQGAYTVKLTVSDEENEVEKEKIVKVAGDLNMDGTNNNGIAELIVVEGETPASRLQQQSARNDNIIINEFLPNPEGADAEGEFIELYNQGNGDVNLISWQVDDSEGGSKPYIFDFDLWLDSGMYYALDREESGLALNNTTDAVRLFDNFNELIEEIEYEAVVEGEAYARGKNGKWFWTTVITPGEENVISVADSNETAVIVKSASYSAGGKKTEQIIETTLDKINKCEVGDLIKVVGIVAVEPGILGSQYFYIVAPSLGPSPATLLRERGANGEIKIASVDFIPSGIGGQAEDNVNASESPSGDSDGAEQEGAIEGEIPESRLQSAGIQVYNYKKDFPKLKIGDYIEVQGELSVSSNELRLKTKTAEDFKIIEHREPPTANEASCEQVDEKYVGQLITVTGEVVERKSSIVYLDDGTDEVIVYIKTATGISPKNIKEGEILAVTGLVGRTKSGIRIMPRSNNDIIKKDPQSHSAVSRVLGEVAVSDVWEIAQRDKKIELFKYLLILAGGVIVVLGGLLVKEVRRG